MVNNTDKTILSTHIRILIGIVSIPSLILAYMIGVMTINGNFQDIGYFEWVYSLIGFFAIYIAITGKRFF